MEIYSQYLLFLFYFIFLIRWMNNPLISIKKTYTVLEYWYQVP